MRAELLFLKQLCNLLKRLFNLFYLLVHPLCVLFLLHLLEAPCSQNSRLKEKSSDKKKAYLRVEQIPCSPKNGQCSNLYLNDATYQLFHHDGYLVDFQNLSHKGVWNIELLPFLRACLDKHPGL